MNIIHRYFINIRLVFGIIFVPRIIDRLSNNDIAREESRSRSVNYNVGDSDLMYLEINGERKKVPNFSFTNQNGDLSLIKIMKGKVYIAEFFFTTCPTICPIMNYNLVEIQNSFNEFDNLGFASFTAGIMILLRC